MTPENIFFYSLSCLAFVYAIRIKVNLFLNRNKLKEVEGRIIYINLVFPEAMMHRNVKLATVEYFVDGKRYVSENYKKMPLSAEVGDVVSVKYFIDKPSMLYTETNVHLYLAIATSIICFLLGTIL